MKYSGNKKKIKIGDYVEYQLASGTEIIAEIASVDKSNGLVKIEYYGAQNKEPIKIKWIWVDRKKVNFRARVSLQQFVKSDTINRAVYVSASKVYSKLFCDGLGAPTEQHDNCNAVNRPAHYTQHPSGVECITITEHMNNNIGNAMKYLWRAGLKGDGQEDLEKAAYFIAREIKRVAK